jgi:superfamily II DNA or RNA helicase
MSAHLRDYQEDALFCIDQAWETRRSTLAVIATGLGKTVIFAEVIKRRQPGRSIVIAHREELIAQAKHKIEHFAGLDCEIEMADQMASTSLFSRMPVVVATVQTLVSGRKKRRMERFNPMDFTTLIIDEAHHGPAETYKQVIAHFSQNPNLKILGVTATPDRADQLAMGEIFDVVAFTFDILEGIKAGYLVPIDQQLVTIAGLDFSHVKTTAGDLNGAELAAIMEAEQNLQGLCSATLDIIGARQTIVFTASVKHAEMACNIFNRHKEGIADWVCGETEKEKRRKTMKAVMDGKTQILVNCGITTEGFDCPGIEVIVMGRPTKSRALFTQMAGRGTRPLPGIVDGIETPEARCAAIAASRKKSCLLVDFVGVSGKHKLMTGLDILGGKFSDEVKAKAQKTLEEDGSPKGIRESLQEAERELIRIAEEKRRAEEARKAKLVAKAKFTKKTVNPFDLFDIAPALVGDKRDGRTLSRKQREILINQGVNPDELPFVHAKQLLDEHFRRKTAGLCTVKAWKCLEKFGYDAKEMPASEAGYLIGKLKENGWRPTGIPQAVKAPTFEPVAPYSEPSGDYSGSQGEPEEIHAGSDELPW